MKVLLIEDNKADYVLIKNMIEEHSNEKVDLHWVSRLKAGMSLAETEVFDIVLLDLGLPDSSGIETFETFYAANKALPIIILSGLDDEYVAIMAVRNGAQDYLPKNTLKPQILKRAMKYAIERKQTEDALRESEEKFKVIFNESLDVIVIIDSYSGLIYNINPACFHIMGYKKKMLIGKHYSTILPDDKYFDKEDFLSKVIINGAVFESQNFVKSDGSNIPMDLSATIIPWGKNKAILVSLRDASERLKVEKAIARLNKELEKRVVERTNQLESTMKELKNEIEFRSMAEEKLNQAKNEITKAWAREKELNELKTRFITMVSHEYRTPLSVISSSAEFLEIYDKVSDPKKFKSHLKKILDSVDSMTRLLENVLTLETIHAPEYKTQVDEVSVKPFIRSIVDTCLYSDKYNHNVNLNIEENIGNIKIERELTKSILFNLISNAMKYSDNGTDININISLKESILIILVQDFGIGIKNEELNYIFEPFHRGENSENVGGFGIGLHIVHSCIKVLEGVIEIDSTEGKGTIVEVRLPIRK